MGKTVKIIIGSITALLIIALLVISISVNSIVKSSIERIGTEMAGTAVTVERVSISALSGSGEISGFRVANPDGYGRDYAVEIENFSISLNLKSLLSDEVLVHEIIIESPRIYLEQKLPGNNLNDIMRHLRDTSPQETSDKQLVIERFYLFDGVADLYTEVGGEREARVEISEIEMNDLGRGGGQQALEEVIERIAERIVDEAMRGAVDAGTDQIRDAIRDLFN
jgi:uncharacterized protein involved in outer membrane biogenesis